MRTLGWHVGKFITSTHGLGGCYDGDQHFEFYFSLNSDDMLSDGLHLKTGETKTVRFALEFLDKVANLKMVQLSLSCMIFGLVKDSRQTFS